MSFKTIDPKLKELKIIREPISLDNPSVSDILDEVFRIGPKYSYSEKSRKNIYFYMDPRTQKFVADNLPIDEVSRIKIKEQYQTMMNQEITNGNIIVSEEIFGVETDVGVTVDMSNKELKYKFLKSIPIDKPINLCTLQMDEIIPRIVILDVIEN